MNLDDLHARFREHLHLDDPSIVDFTVAVAVAARLPNDPVWALVVAPPSSGKTETLQSLEGLKFVYKMSSFTQSTLISGKQGKEGTEPSLLLRLPRTGTLLVLKDFGTIMSMRDETRAEILQQLREIYDGSYKKDFGTGSSITWKGRLGFLAGTTGAIDHHHAVLSILGERFLYYRLPEADRRTVATIASMTSEGDRMRADLSAAVRTFVDELLASDAQVPELADHLDIRDRLVALSDVVTWSRTAVYRDRYTRDIEVAPTPEGPGRFVKQLVALWKSLEAMSHPDSMTLVRRVALDSMPPARSAVLRMLINGQVRDTNEIREATDLSGSANRRVIEDLEALKVVRNVTRGGKGQGIASTWALTNDALERWTPVLSPPQSQEREGKEEYIDGQKGRGLRGTNPDGSFASIYAQTEEVQL